LLEADFTKPTDPGLVIPEELLIMAIIEAAAAANRSGSPREKSMASRALHILVGRQESDLV
jgi:hypothetical protein